MDLIKKLLVAIIAMLLAVIAYSPTIVLGAENDNSTSVRFKVINQVEGKIDSATPFLFQLEGKENAPMPSNNQLTIKGTGEASFEKITYSNVGVYYYKISRVNNSLSGYSDDFSKYIVQVTVTYHPENPTQLVATVTAYKSGEDMKKELLFKTIYRGESKQTYPSTSNKVVNRKSILPSTGETKNILMILGCLVLCVIIAYKYRSKNI